MPLLAEAILNVNSPDQTLLREIENHYHLERISQDAGQASSAGRLTKQCLQNEGFRRCYVPTSVEKINRSELEKIQQLDEKRKLLDRDLNTAITSLGQTKDAVKECEWARS
jgi:hypothetical protein